MRTPARILMTSLLLTPAFLNAAEGTDSRACNLQGREIALRITEEVSGELTADDRTRIAAIAEEVCLGFAPNARNRSAQSGGTPVISRPVASEQATTAVAAPQAAEAEAQQTDEEDDGGLFGNIRIIDPEDRVKRPGLKRP